LTEHEDEMRRRAERARRVALFRYEVIQDAIDPALTARQRGRLVRDLAGREHTDPFGTPVTVGRNTVDRWIRTWRTGGFAALTPSPAKVAPRTPAEVLELAAALKREKPERTAAQVARVLRAQAGWAPSDRTLQRHFARAELTGAVKAPVEVFGRFEADRPNELWTGDALCRDRHKASYMDPVVMPMGGNCPRWWGYLAPCGRHNQRPWRKAMIVSEGW